MGYYVCEGFELKGLAYRAVGLRCKPAKCNIITDIFFAIHSEGFKKLSISFFFFIVPRLKPAVDALNSVNPVFFSLHVENPVALAVRRDS